MECNEMNLAFSFVGLMSQNYTNNTNKHIQTPGLHTIQY